MLLVALIYFRPWLNVKGQAERAHGIALPSEASNITTVGDWRRGFLDRGASTTFTLDAFEVDSFIAKISNAKATKGAGPPINEIYHRGLYDTWESLQENGEAFYTVTEFEGVVNDRVIRVLKFTQKPRHAYITKSYKGDFLTVEVFDLTESLSGIRMYTDWN